VINAYADHYTKFVKGDSTTPLHATAAAAKQPEKKQVLNEPPVRRDYRMPPA
jgi:hypothetical protein